MSLEDDRAEFVDALNTVDGITGYSIQPSILSAGDAFPNWRGWQRDEGILASTWSVTVILPNDISLALDAVSALAEEIVVALAPVAYTETLEPVAYEVENAGTLPALQLRLIKEF